MAELRARLSIDLSPAELDELRGRFASFVDRNGPVPHHAQHLGNCHVWTGSRAGSKGAGRGKLKIRGRNFLAHRVAFFLAHGRWPEPCALHHCDGGSLGCVRAEHLFEGTYADNTADMVAKGRCGRGAARGEASARARLTNKTVFAIREALAAGESQRAIARRFAVGKSTIGSIAVGKAWAHLAQ